MPKSAFNSSDINFNDFYTGGMDPRRPFIAEPGSLPSAYRPDVQRQTAEGLNVRGVRSVAIDPTTGRPLLPYSGRSDPLQASPSVAEALAERDLMRGDGSDAITQALLERGFNATPYEGYGDYNPYRSGAVDPGMVQQPDGYGFAYGPDAPTSPTNPGQQAINNAIMPPMPIPRPDPYDTTNGRLDAGGPFGGGWGSSAMHPDMRLQGVDWSQTAPDGLRPDGTYGGPQTGFAADPVNVTVNGGVRMPMGAPVKRKVTPAVPQGPGANGHPGAGTIKNNPTKYGKTQQDRNDYANARQAFLASWNSA